MKCFYCDGGLRNWQPEDAPWVEHARWVLTYADFQFLYRYFRWFSKCVFVRLVKGDEFIAKCLAERPPEKVRIFKIPFLNNFLGGNRWQWWEAGN